MHYIMQLNFAAEVNVIEEHHLKRSVDKLGFSLYVCTVQTEFMYATLQIYYIYSREVDISNTRIYVYIYHESKTVM